MAKKKVTCEACHKGISEGHSRIKLRQLCVECHKEKAYGKMLDEWQEGIRQELADLDRLIGKAEVLLAEGTGLSRGDVAALRAARAAARRAAARVRRDGSLGAHNIEYVYSILADAAEGLGDALSAP